jgi:hypothetical protein
MDSRKQVLEDAIKTLGFKKVLGELLSVAKLIDEKTVGNFTANLNSGGVTDAFINKKVQ